MIRYLNGFALYDPNKAQQIAQHLANGHSLRGASGAPGIDIPLPSIYHWLETIPDFHRQITIATQNRVHQLELRALNTKDGVQAKVLLQALRRAAPEAWDDPRTTPHHDTTTPALPTTITISAAPTQTNTTPPQTPATPPQTPRSPTTTLQ